MADVEDFLKQFPSARTVDAYRRDLRAYEKACETMLVSPASAERYHLLSIIEGWERQGLAPSSVRRRVAAVASYHAYLIERGSSISTPPSAIPRPDRPSVPDAATAVLGFDDFSLLIGAPGRNQPSVALLGLLLVCGPLRLDDALALTRRSLARHADHTPIRLPDGRNIPLPPVVRDLIEVVADDTHIFAGRSGSIARQTATRRLLAAGRASGIAAPTTAQRLRSSSFRILVEAGVRPQIAASSAWSDVEPYLHPMFAVTATLEADGTFSMLP